ncbi:hypothetical protein [Natronorarus salvus]|jgi:rubrerythrin
MSLADTVRRWLDDDAAVIYECRECGTALDSDELMCPSCGSTDVSEYDVR